MTTYTILPILILALIAAVCNALLIWRHDREIASRDRQINRQCALIAELYARNADLRYQLDDQRLNMAVRWYRRNVEYAYIGLDGNAADRSYDVYRN